MSHLTCIQHGRRVVYTPTNIIHRNGDRSKCESEEFKFYKGCLNETREDLLFDARRRETAASNAWHKEFEELWASTDPKKQEYEGRWEFERPKDSLLEEVADTFLGVLEVVLATTQAILGTMPEREDFEDFLDCNYWYQEMLKDPDKQEDLIIIGKDE